MGNRSAYIISTELVIIYCTGSSPYDIILTHGVSCKSILVSVCEVADTMSPTKELGSSFSSQQEQCVIATGFYEMIGDIFDNVIRDLDCLLIWIVKPYLSWCRMYTCEKAQYNCHRKDKFRMNL